jgi:hypothetical protein
MRRIESVDNERITSGQLCGLLLTMSSVDALPDDAASLKRLLLARDEELAVARARCHRCCRSGKLASQGSR